MRNFVAFFCLLPIGLVAQTGKLQVNLSNFENTNGKAVVKIYRSRAGFPLEDDDAYKIVRVPITDKQISVLIENLPIGKIAVMAFHDKNGNGKIDRNWVGFPQERLGISNYRKLRKPNFDKAKFSIEDGKTTQITIVLDTPL